MALPLLPGWRHASREITPVAEQKEQYPLIGDDGKPGADGVDPEAQAKSRERCKVLVVPSLLALLVGALVSVGVVPWSTKTGPFSASDTPASSPFYAASGVSYSLVVAGTVDSFDTEAHRSSAASLAGVAAADVEVLHRHVRRFQHRRPVPVRSLPENLPLLTRQTCGPWAAQVRHHCFGAARRRTERREWGVPCREFCQIGTGSSAPHDVFTPISQL
jgi:hypothetical protein